MNICLVALLDGGERLQRHDASPQHLVRRFGPYQNANLPLGKFLLLLLSTRFFKVVDDNV